jgi:hypothetical protein
MTKKEKKELAEKLKAEIIQKKEITTGLPSKEHLAQNNHRRTLLQKAKSKKGNYLSGSKYKPHHPLLDPDP